MLVVETQAYGIRNLTSLQNANTFSSLIIRLKFLEKVKPLMKVKSIQTLKKWSDPTIPNSVKTMKASRESWKPTKSQNVLGHAAVQMLLNHHRKRVKIIVKVLWKVAKSKTLRTQKLKRLKKKNANVHFWNVNVVQTAVAIPKHAQTAKWPTSSLSNLMKMSLRKLPGVLICVRLSTLWKCVQMTCQCSWKVNSLRKSSFMQFNSRKMKATTYF